MRLMRALGLIAILAVGLAGGAAQATSLSGQVLVAKERMPDPRFQETVIYLVDHDENGAFGLVVNKPVGDSTIAALLDKLGIDPGDDGGVLRGSITLHWGGPVEPESGYILHSADYAAGDTRLVPGGFALTRHTRVLQDIAHGRGPRRSLLLFGYCGWGPGQLEGEFARGDWAVVEADAELVLGTDHEDKWRRALGGGGMVI